LHNLVPPNTSRAIMRPAVSAVKQLRGCERADPRSTQASLALILAHGGRVSESRGSVVPIERIESRILLVRGHKVCSMPTSPTLYGVQTRRLNEQVRRNLARFPPISCSSSRRRVRAFDVAICDISQAAAAGANGPGLSEHGALMAATVLSSARAVKSASTSCAASCACARRWPRTRTRLEAPCAEKKTEALALRHDGFAASTRLHLRQVFDAIRELMRAPEPIKRRPIGFVNPDEKKRS